MYFTKPIHVFSFVRNKTLNSSITPRMHVHGKIVKNYKENLPIIMIALLIPARGVDYDTHKTT